MNALKFLFRHSKEEGFSTLETLFTLTLLSVFALLSLKSMHETHRYFRDSEAALETVLSHSEFQAASQHSTHLPPNKTLHCQRREQHSQGFAFQRCKLHSANRDTKSFSLPSFETEFRRIHF